MKSCDAHHGACCEIIPLEWCSFLPWSERLRCTYFSGQLATARAKGPVQADTFCTQLTSTQEGPATAALQSGVRRSEMKYT